MMPLPLMHIGWRFRAGSAESFLVCNWLTGTERVKVVRCRLQLRFQILREAATIEKPPHGIGKFREEVCTALMPDFSSSEIDLDFISFVNVGIDLSTFHNWQSGVDCIPIERPREGNRDNCLDAESLDRRDRLFAGTTAAKVT